jgi:hypothetical protein
MKGIYLTQEAKQEIEAKIAELEKADLFYQKNASSLNPNYASNSTQLKIYKEILLSATILPVEKSYNDIQHFETKEYGTIIRKHFLMANYSKGVIIQPK